MAEPDTIKDGLRPASSLVEDENLDGLAQLVNEAFPDLACLRCSNEKFYLALATSVVPFGRFQLPGDLTPRGHFDHIDLICTRCGYVERHELTILRSATRPIIKE